MVQSGCYRFSKYALICITLIFGVLGLGGLVLVIPVLKNHSFYSNERDFTVGVYGHLINCCFLLIIAFLGCCGAIRMSKRLLVACFSCLVIWMVGQIAVAAWLYSNSDSLQDLLKSTMMNTVKNEYGEIESATQSMDQFQSGLGCCGVTGPEDYAGSKYANQNPSTPLSLTVSAQLNVYKVPKSCCKLDEQGPECTLARNIKVAGVVSPDIYSEGCVGKMMNELKSISSILIGIFVGLRMLEIFALIFLLILCCGFSSTDRYKA